MVTLVLSYLLSSGQQHLWGRGSYSRKLKEHVKGISLPTVPPVSSGQPAAVQWSQCQAGGGAGTGTNLAPHLTPALAAVLCQDSHLQDHMVNEAEEWIQDKNKPDLTH